VIDINVREPPLHRKPLVAHCYGHEPEQAHRRHERDKHQRRKERRWALFSAVWFGEPDFSILMEKTLVVAAEDYGRRRVSIIPSDGGRRASSLAVGAWILNMAMTFSIDARHIFGPGSVASGEVG